MLIDVCTPLQLLCVFSSSVSLAPLCLQFLCVFGSSDSSAFWSLSVFGSSVSSGRFCSLIIDYNVVIITILYSHNLGHWLDQQPVLKQNGTKWYFYLLFMKDVSLKAAPVTPDRPENKQHLTPVLTYPLPQPVFTPPIVIFRSKIQNNLTNTFATSKINQLQFCFHHHGT